MRPKGTLQPNGELATLEFERHYPHAIEHVWDAIATEEGLRGWLMCTLVEIEARVGGRIELRSGPPGYHSRGVVLAWEPPHLLEYEWNVAALPEMPKGERAIFRFALRSEDDGRATHLQVTYSRLTRETARGFLPGLHAFLDRLEAQLAHESLPDWFALFGTLRALYPEWSDASDPGK
jgi:uncharacterized protein YndB with AHSA1/START domain